MNAQLKLSVSPHIHSGKSTSRIMLDVLISLLPATIAGCLKYCLISQPISPSSSETSPPP